ncbi:MAG: urease accessory protein UreD [Alphaproteobacteria bacterium]|nr:urease accessory protein UreD [Alphaproteobacteria bacterium]
MENGDSTRGLARPAVNGRAGAAFARDPDGVVRLKDLDQRDPLKILFPDPLAEGQPVAVLVNTGGGVVGGDRLSTEIDLGPGAEALVVGQSAEKIYRSWGPASEIRNRLTVGAGGRLEWFPQETILFDKARLDRSLDLDLAPGATFLGGEIVVYGRRARGETMTGGSLRDGWRVRREGRLVWADRFIADPVNDALLDRPALLGGARASAMLVCATGDAAGALEIARSQAGVSCGLVGGLLVARLLDPDVPALRARYCRLWQALRHGVFGLPDGISRLWHV